MVANTAVSLPDLTDIKSIERATFGIKVDFEGVLSYEGTITVEDGRVVSFEVAGDLNVRGFMAGVTMEQTDSGFNGAVSFGFGVQNQAKTNKAKVTATISFDERGLHSLSMGLAAAANTRNDFLGNAHISAEAGIELNGRTEENAISIKTEIGSDLTGHHSIQANYVGEAQDLTYVNSDPEQGLLLGSPIMLDLNRDGRVDLVDLAESSASFDLDGDGFRENVSWVGPDDGFLVADLNNDGRITFAAELAISEQTAAPDSDMEALSSVYDADGNGLVDAADDGFEKLRVWQDKDQDGEVDEGELRTLAQAGIQSIDVDSGAGWPAPIEWSTV